jgi:1-acyl-sn-glycerol-3-phosphate acyltransferase
MYPSYPLPLRLGLGVLWSVARKGRRSFQQDAITALSLCRFPIQVMGGENIPTCGPAVVVTNHYSRPGFGAWWIALTISAQVPAEMHWGMTAAWTFDGSLTSGVLAEISRKLFPRIAEIYNFTSMPPMPPRPFEQAARAQSVRRMLAVAKSQPPPIFGMAPEGQDTPDGALMRSHPGVGRFLYHLARLGYPFYPVGVHEETNSLCLSFGLPFRLELPGGLMVEEIDDCASQMVMQAIARQLPEGLRGEF